MSVEGGGGTSTQKCPYPGHAECESVSPALHNDSSGVNGVMGVHICHDRVISHTGCVIGGSKSINSVLMDVSK